MGWDIVPWGFEKLLSWIQKEYSPKGGILVSWNHLTSALKSKVVWKWFHVAFFACSAVYANLCMSSKQY